MSKNLEIIVPGSIANLGAGFDTLAVAVQLYLRLRVKVLDGQGQLNFRFVNQELKGENYIERAFRFLARQRDDCFPSLDVEVYTDIPMRAGLGSSAAATVAGLRLYEALTFPQPTQALLNAACALEGHPDNVSAALLGGLTVSCQLPDGSAYSARMKWPEELAFIVLTPDVPLATSDARRVLPVVVPRQDAVFNIQRVALFLQVLQSGNYELLKQSMADRLHQPFRQSLVPGLEAALNLEHDDLLGVCLSGAGPSIVCIAERNLNHVERLLCDAYARTGIPYQVRQLRVHQGNAEEDRPALAGACCA